MSEAPKGGSDMHIYNWRGEGKWRIEHEHCTEGNSWEVRGPLSSDFGRYIECMNLHRKMNGKSRLRSLGRYDDVGTF